MSEALITGQWPHVDGFRPALETLKHAHSRRYSYAQESAEIVGCGLKVHFLGQKVVSSKFATVTFFNKPKGKCGMQKRPLCGVQTQTPGWKSNLPHFTSNNMFSSICAIFLTQWLYTATVYV